MGNNSATPLNMVDTLLESWSSEEDSLFYFYRCMVMQMGMRSVCAS